MSNPRWVPLSVASPFMWNAVAEDSAALAARSNCVGDRAAFEPAALVLVDGNPVRPDELTAGEVAPPVPCPDTVEAHAARAAHAPTAAAILTSGLRMRK